MCVAFTTIHTHFVAFAINTFVTLPQTPKATIFKLLLSFFYVSEGGALVTPMTFLAVTAFVFVLFICFSTSVCFNWLSNKRMYRCLVTSFVVTTFTLCFEFLFLKLITCFQISTFTFNSLFCYHIFMQHLQQVGD